MEELWGARQDQTNLYAYVYNDPVNNEDPDGECGPLCGFVVGAIIDGGIEAGTQILTSGKITDPGRIVSKSLQGGVIGAVTSGVGNLVKLARTGRNIATTERAAASQATQRASTKAQTGSYTNTHASGKTYSGKGGTARSQESGRRIGRETGDQHTATDWSKSKSNREAFKDESRRLDAEGGPKSPNNYNSIESPGKKMRKNDGD